MSAQSTGPALDLPARFALARAMAVTAGTMALDYFNAPDALTVEAKRNPQDLVSQADREVEIHLRETILAAFPDDAILGEEFGLQPGRSGFTWVLDPIDGTSPFLNRMPNWCVSIGGMMDGAPALGVINAPCSGEIYAAARGMGATLNGATIRVTDRLDLRSGVVGLGSNDRVPADAVGSMVAAILGIGGSFMRNGSGALMLAYVAAGRLVGYAEPRINSWDCMAAYCLVAEAGGRMLPFPTSGAALMAPAPVLAAAPGVYDELMALTRLQDDAVWAPVSAAE